MKRVAVVGTGIAGMGCGHFLHDHFDLTFYEKASYIGGHTNTVTVEEGEKPIYIDTGFMVYNHVTYPNLVELFARLGVIEKDTSMSFSVQHRPSGLEFSGSGLSGLFAQRRNFLNPRFIRMLAEINRFNTECLELLNGNGCESHTLAEYIQEKRYGRDILERYLIPMSSAVWSTPPDRMMNFPAITLVRFFHNHGFLGLNTQHQWKTLEGGSRVYRDRIIAPFRDRIFTNRSAIMVRRSEDGVSITDQYGCVDTYDIAILACHADEALQMLEKPTSLEEELLSVFTYQRNIATLHTDASLMPRLRRVWSSWNYRLDRNTDGSMTASTIYWMNSLQHVSEQTNYFISINGAERIHPNLILYQTEYEHPIFTLESIKAQHRLDQINEKGPIYFCGSYFKYGFHEDALTSAIQLSERLLNRR